MVGGIRIVELSEVNLSEVAKSISAKALEAPIVPTTGDIKKITAQLHAIYGEISLVAPACDQAIIGSFANTPLAA